MNTKAPQRILTSLLPYFDDITVTRFENTFRKCYSPKELVKIASRITDKKINSSINPHLAMQKLLQRMNGDDTLIITGSFFLAGELRTHWISEEEILSNNTARHNTYRKKHTTKT